MREWMEAMRCRPDFYGEKGASMAQIEDAEKALGLSFAPDFRECLHEFGAISLGGHELTGFSADKNLDVVEVTRRYWGKRDSEKNLYVIEEAHIDGILVWQDTGGAIYETGPNAKARKIASSLVEYLGLNQQ